MLIGKIPAPTHLQLKIDGVLISKQHGVKFLGIYLDQHLTWTDHIAHVKSKLSKSLYALNCIKKYVPGSRLRMLYYTMIHTYLQYGITLWGSANPSNLQKIIRLQKKAVRIISHSVYNATTPPLFKRAQILNMTDMYKTESLKLMYDILNGNAPEELLSIFSQNIDIHEHNTRHRHNVHIQSQRTHKASMSFLHNGPRLWSALPQTICTEMSKKCFKRQVKSHFLNMYE